MALLPVWFAAPPRHAMTASSPNELHSLIDSEKRRLLNADTPVAVLGSVGIVAVIALTQQGHTDRVAAMAWAGGMLASLLVALACWRALRGAPDARFLSAFTLLAYVQGLAWASCALLVRPDDFGHEAFMLLTLCVIFTSGSVYYGRHLPALHGHELAGLGSLALIYATRGGFLNWSIAAGAAILAGVLIIFGRTFHHGLARAVELGFENARLVEQLTQANAAKTRFLASASHDLRQPLHALSLLIGLLGERARGQGLEDLIHRVQASTEAMESLLNGILDISRLDAGVERPEPVALPARELVDRIERQFTPIAAARGLRLHVRPSTHWVKSDAALLMRMLDNLVSNALRYTARGGVVLGVRPRGAGLAFEVWDTGLGIPPEKLDEVFQEFVQLHNPQRDRSQGLGLGLSIVQRTAQLLGHGIEVASRPGRGSVFRVIVPRAEPPAAGMAAGNALPPEIAPHRLQGLQVLVVDDEQPIQFALQGLLEAWGCTCHVAGNSAEALRRVAPGERPPDAILCDYRLEHETGVELVARLREALGEDVPALVVTGDVTTSQLIDIAASDLPVMHKPVSPAALRAWLGSVAETALTPPT